MAILLNLDDVRQAEQGGYVSDVANIERELFDDAWDGLAVQSVLSQFGAGVLVLYDEGDDDDECMGYLIYQIVFEVAEILRIATAHTHQKQGVGARLMREFITLCQSKGAERILLEVRADNAPAIRLYEKHGFTQIDVRKGYYKDEWGVMDALILQRELG
ncbi:MAG: ribosomal protein S18-alanine N-acetyltransferase [Moraxella sp.]|nr:ribosomal protein S18-alanine N-acetyltransferase [Moraxella sp.]